MTTIFLSGPMTDLPNFNHAEFCRHAERLRADGYTVLNPAETDGCSKWRPRKFYMRAALTMLMQADSVAVLPGWQKSRGAFLEVTAAHELGLPVYEVDTIDGDILVEIQVQP